MVFVIPASMLFEYYGFPITVGIVLIFVSFFASIFFALEEYGMRKSFKACLNKFNILCQTNLVGLFIYFLFDVLSWFVLTFPDEMTQYNVDAASQFLSNLGFNMAISSYLYYTYSRSDVLLWGNKIRAIARFFVFLAIFICGLDQILRLVVAVMGATPVWIAFPSLINAILIISLDIFYTRVFSRQVKESNSVFRSATNDKDVIAHYGRLQVIFNIISLLIYMISYGLLVQQIKLAGYSLQAISRVFMVASMLFMVGMKYKLNKLSVERSRNASTQQASGSKMAASKPVTQNKVKKTNDIESGNFDNSAATNSADTSGTTSTNGSESKMMSSQI